MGVDSKSFSIWEVFRKSAEAYPDKEAVYDLVRRVNYGDLKREVEHTASMFHSLGITTGDKIATALPNWHETVVLFLAAARVGAVLVPINPKYRLHEIQ